MQDNKNEIILFEDQNIKLQVNMKGETVWLSLDQMAQLFGRDKSVISKHIKNVLKEELSNNAVVAKFATTANDGKTYQVDYYNLDVIISVGYRVKSQNGITFRKWANRVLKDYLIKGYAVNEKRLDYLEKTVKLIDIASRNYDNIDSINYKDIIKVLKEYSKSLNLLDDYDHHTLNKPKGKTSQEKITYKNAKDLIETLKFNEKSDLFAIERNKGLESIIKNLYVTFNGNDVYPSIEEKAANFLYLVVKNHVFIDGNKRIAATLFIYFLQFYGILYIENKQIIDNNTLAALTLLIAESNPHEKEIMIDLIRNFLN